MADYTALVEAGEALAELLRHELTPEPINDRELISIASPFEAENNQLTLYLFQIDEDLQSGYSGYIQESANVQRMQPAQFQLSYLVTAHSKAPVHMKESDQQRIIGKVVQVVKDYPAIPLQFLRGSMAGSGVTLNLSLERPNFEQMLKIWNNTQIPYKLSVVVKIAGVSIESGRTRYVPRVTDVIFGSDQKEIDK